MKRLAALFCAFGLLTCLLAGCKIEFPEDAAGSVPPVSSQSLSAGTAPAETAAAHDTAASGESTETASAADTAGDASAPAPGTTANPASPPSAPAGTSPSTAPAATAATTAGTVSTAPAQPQPLTCTLSIDCTTLLGSLDKLPAAKRGLVPADGVLLSERTVLFEEGDTVFDLLNRETKKNRIHMAFRSVPALNSQYIEAIHNLYEKDAGDMSGWMYDVNGVFPNYGCSQYTLKAGDVVRWRYTCDLGRDLGTDVSQW